MPGPPATPSLSRDTAKDLGRQLGAAHGRPEEIPMNEIPMNKLTRRKPQRTARRLGRAALFAAVRGIATAAGSAVVAGGLVWWQSR